MKHNQSIFAVSLCAVLLGSVGCLGTSDAMDNGLGITDVVVTPDNDTLSKGASLQFTAIAHYADGTTRDVTRDSSTVWNTSNAAIAVVSEDGMVTAMTPGLVDISASYKGEKGDEHFAVTP